MLLSITITTVWVRSYFASDGIGRLHYAPGIPSEDHHVWLFANRGTLEVIGGGDPIENFSDVRWEGRHWPVQPYPPLDGVDGPHSLRLIGISWRNPVRVTTGEWYWTISVRIWLMATLSILSTIFLIRPWKWMLASHVPGTCRRCGYDLRATPHRCPECGMVPITAAISN